MNDQRKVIFEQRLDIMAEEDVSETIKDLRHQLVARLASATGRDRAFSARRHGVPPV